MRINDLDSTYNVIADDVDVDNQHMPGETDARRRMEDKIEEIRLKRDTQEFDFDI